MELAFGVAICLACGFSLAMLDPSLAPPPRKSSWDQFLLPGSLSIGSIIFFLTRILGSK